MTGEMGGLPGDIRQTSRKTYPLSKKETTAKEPDWTLKLEESGAKKEIEDPEYAHKTEAPYNKKYHEDRKK